MADKAADEAGLWASLESSSSKYECILHIVKDAAEHFFLDGAKHKSQEETHLRALRQQRMDALAFRRRMRLAGGHASMLRAWQAVIRLDLATNRVKSVCQALNKARIENHVHELERAFMQRKLALSFRLVRSLTGLRKGSARTWGELPLTAPPPLGSNGLRQPPFLGGLMAGVPLKFQALLRLHQ